MKGKLRIQPRVKGGRLSVHPSVLKEIRFELVRIARENNVSVSWVAATIFADALKVRSQVRYDEAEKSKRKRTA